MRYREVNQDTELRVSGFELNEYNKFVCNTKHKTIQDVNNGRSPKNRPLSPCKAMEANYYPELVPNINDMGFGNLNCPARSYAGYVEILVGRELSNQYELCLSRIRRKVDAQIGSFSTLNFLYELRELPDTFKKLKTPEDFRYIDWQFAISPMLSDLKSALLTYNAQVGSLNEKLKKYRSIPFSTTINGLILDQGQRSYFVGNGHYQEDTARVITRCRGTIEMDIPYFAQVCPELFRVLDDLSIDVSASNAWNALPWSWFFDWFLNIGDFLESLPSGMKPNCGFRGTISHEVNSFSDLFTYGNDHPSFLGGFPAGKLTCKMYVRNPFGHPLSSMHKWRLDSLSSPSQIVLLRDIMFPADIQRGKSIIR